LSTWKRRTDVGRCIHFIVATIHSIVATIHSIVATIHSIAATIPFAISHLIYLNCSFSTVPVTQATILKYTMPPPPSAD